MFAALVTPSAQAQTYKVIHYFTGGGDGGNPEAGLSIVGAGNFYGTTAGGGTAGYGTVFKLAQKGSGWVVTPLYSFAGGNDGIGPVARAIVGPDGSLYGTTGGGGGTSCTDGNGNIIGCGTVFK